MVTAAKTKVSRPVKTTPGHFIQARLARQARVANQANRATSRTSTNRLTMLTIIVNLPESIVVNSVRPANLTPGRR